ncbi:MAG: MFS transporter [Halobacteriaceae archaeon]
MSDGFHSNLGLFKDPEFVALAGTAFARSQAYSTILIALALYADLFGTTGFIEGMFGTAFAIVQLLIVLPLGRGIDTGNAKRYLLLGLLLNICVFFGFMLVSNAIHVILIRIVQGIGASILWITGSTVIGEISPEGGRGRWLGTYNQVAAFSSLAGDIFGGYLLFAYNFRFTYVILSVITLLAFLLVFAFLRENPGGQKDPEEATGVETIQNLLGLPMIKSLVTFRLAFSVGKMAVIIFLPIYARKEFGVSAFHIGWILAGGKLSKSLLQGYMGNLADRIGNRHYFVAVGGLLYAVGTAIIPLAAYANTYLPVVTINILSYTGTISGAFITMFFAFSILGVADSIRLPASMSLFVEEGEKYDSVASSMSLRSIAWKIGQISGPLAVGIIKDTVSTLAAFWTAAAFILVATGMFLYMYSRSSEIDTPVEPTPGD